MRTLGCCILIIFFIEVLCECGVLGVAFLIAMLVAHFRYQRLNVFVLDRK